MTIKRLAAIIFILICTTGAWVILGSSLLIRSQVSHGNLDRAVTGGWGPVMTQQHPVIYYHSPGSPDGKHLIQPSTSEVKVKLDYDPKKKGLLWYRTYLVDFEGRYSVENPTPITQTIYVKFQFPANEASYNNFSFVLNGVASTENGKTSEGIVEAVTLQPGEKASLSVAYHSRGTNSWIYSFGNANRIRNFQLKMNTDFEEIDFPANTSSPTTRSFANGNWNGEWSYPDVINAQAIGMDMPNVLNPGPVASRISFFAPVSLLFFFSVLIIVGTVKGVNLHPMNYFFLAAGAFAFQLLFAYLVDLIPLHLAFFISAAVSLALVSGYLFAAASRDFARIAALAQFAYMVLFSYSFFFDGLTGLTITIGAILTLALLMASTAKVNWAVKFGHARAAA
jgi:hypothetical protein